LWSDRNACLAQKICEVLALSGKAQRDHITLCTGTSRAARAVQISLVFHRRIDVDDQVDVVDVDSACGNIGCHQNLHCTLAKCREVAVSGWLGEVSVEVNRRNPCVC
jgi:hypothetical protein